MTKPINKTIALNILSQAIDIANQNIWYNVQLNKLDKKRAEHMLVNFESAFLYCKKMLHDVLTGKTAQYVEEVDGPSGSVLIGHQANATYIRLSFDDIWDLSVRCWEAEEEYLEKLQKELDEAERQRDEDDKTMDESRKRLKEEGSNVQIVKEVFAKEGIEMAE